MSTKENKELVRQIIKEWNAVNGDVAKMRSLYDRYYAPGFIYHDVSGGDMNREEAIQNNVTDVSAFSDLNFSIDDMLAEGDKTVIRFTMQATHKGTFMGIAATGRRIVVKGVEIDKIVGGKIVETWDFLDSMGMMTQLGVITGAAPKT
jgi:predicted ester cyclase